MQECLAATNNDIQAVLSENDSMAGGVIAALEEVGLDIPVSGQDGDIPALNRVALGSQTVSVWKDSGALGRVAGHLAVQLHEGTTIDKLSVEGLEIPAYAAPPAGTAAVQFTTPGGAQVWSITLNPNPVQQANLNEPIDSGWATKEQVCANVTDTSAVPACA
jgi:D-xylose transport system substrate-binding protein